MNSERQRMAAGWSRYIVYPLLVVGILLGVSAAAAGVRSGIPFLAGVGCFFGAWLAHTRSSSFSREKANTIKMFLMFLGLVFAVISKVIDD